MTGFGVEGSEELVSNVVSCLATGHMDVSLKSFMDLLEPSSRSDLISRAQISARRPSWAEQRGPRRVIEGGGDQEGFGDS